VLKHVESNASVLGVQVVAVNATTPQGIEAAFAEAAQQGATALIVAADAFFSAQGSQIASSAAPDMSRRAAEIVDKILRGAKPAEISSRPSSISSLTSRPPKLLASQSLERCFPVPTR